MERNNFLIQMSFKDSIDSISDQQAGQVFKGLFRYVATGEIQANDPVSKALIFVFKSSIDEATRRYVEKCNKNRDNAGKRWNGNRKQSDANGCERIQSESTAYECMHNDNEDEYDNENDKDKITPKGVRKNAGRCLPSLTQKEFNFVLELWNDVCANLPHVVKLTSKNGKRCNRKRAISDCLNFLAKEFTQNKTLDEAMDVLGSAFEKINASKFCRGESGGSWKANFDWVMKPENIVKVIEGNYDDVVSISSKPGDINDLWDD